MHELYELKDKLCEELKEYGGQEMSVGSLDVVDKLTHTIKNLDKIIEAYDEEYSEDMGRESYEGSYRGGMRSYRGGRDGRSYRRGRSYARGRYSRDDEMISELNELMESAPNEKTKQEFKRFIAKIESM
jgi:hypothetical protein